MRSPHRWIFTAIGAVALSGVLPAQAADVPPSAIGNQIVEWIAVSPAYRDTGFVVAATVESGCSKNCNRLWVTHDGGSSWRRARAHGWNGGRLRVAVDSNGNDVVYSDGPARSGDDGQTWTTIGSGGVPTPSVTYPQDGNVAVAAGAHDYVLHGTSERRVSGSGGSLTDFEFFYAPTFPNAGSFSPAFLVGINSQDKHVYVEGCAQSLSCSSPTLLAGSNGFSLPVTMLPSSDFKDDGVVFAKAGRGIYKSKDGGKTFAVLPVVGPGATATAYPMMALAPGYKEAGPIRTAYVAVLQVFQPSPAELAQHKSPHSSGGVYRTTDGGLTWAQVGSGSPLDNGASGVAVASDGRLFAGYLPGLGSPYAGLLCSNDGGSTWKASCPAVGSKGRASGQQSCTGSACASTGGSSGGASPQASGNGSSGGGKSGGGQAIGTGRTGVLGSVSSRWPIVLAVAAVLIALLGALIFFVMRRRRGPAAPSG